MGVVLGIFVAVLLLTMAEPAPASELGRVAATMATGTWAQVTTNNIGAVSQALYGPPGFDDNQVWNSKKRKMMMEIATHGAFSSCPGVCPIGLITYDDETNTWTTGGAQPPAINAYHVYDHVAWDDANEVMYFRYYSSKRVVRYCVNNTPSWCVGRQGTWTDLPAAPSQMWQAAGGLTYHETMDGGSLLYFDGAGASQEGCGALIRFRESTGTWDILHSGAGCFFADGSYHNVAEYSPVKQVAVFGGGNANVDCAVGNRCRHLWKIDAAKTITRLDDAPVMIGFGGSNRSMVADPVSGNFIFISGTSPGTGAMWELNPTAPSGQQWTLLDGDLRGAGEICNTMFDTSQTCSGNFYGASNRTYGVIMYWKYTGAASGELWLYKHKPLAPPAQPTSLTVK